MIKISDGELVVVLWDYGFEHQDITIDGKRTEFHFEKTESVVDLVSKHQKGIGIPAKNSIQKIFQLYRRFLNIVHNPVSV